jgi:hypothetical protein
MDCKNTIYFNIHLTFFGKSLFANRQSIQPVLAHFVLVQEFNLSEFR